MAVPELTVLCLWRTHCVVGKMNKYRMFGFGIFAWKASWCFCLIFLPKRQWWEGLLLRRNHQRQTTIFACRKQRQKLAGCMRLQGKGTGVCIQWFREVCVYYFGEWPHSFWVMCASLDSQVGWEIAKFVPDIRWSCRGQATTLFLPAITATMTKCHFCQCWLDTGSQALCIVRCMQYLKFFLKTLESWYFNNKGPEAWRN